MSLSEENSASGSEAMILRSTALSGLCSLVPIPFLDDILIRRVRKGMIRKVLWRHGKEADSAVLRGFYERESRGCMATVFGLLFTLVKKTLRKFFRTIFFFLAVRAAALVMTETFLAGRTAERVLRGDSAVGRDSEPDRIRSAFQNALKGSDREILSGAIVGARTITFGDRGFLRRNRSVTAESSERNDPLDPEDFPDGERRKIQRISVQLRKALESPAVQEFLSRFDRRFDAALTGEMS